MSMAATRRLIQRRRERREQAQTGSRLVLRGLVALALIVVGLNLLGAITGFGTIASVYASYSQELPEPGAITVVEQDFETTKIYDRTGTILLYEVIDPLGGDRTWVELADIPLHFRQATIAIEDKTFYENPGYDTEGILRALWNNLLGGEIQGGSSITQQLVKNVLIAPEERAVVSYDRKVRELILAVRISDEYSKDQILEWYLNTNFYGNLAYGVEAAARVYYGKSARDLSPALDSAAPSRRLRPRARSPAPPHSPISWACILPAGRILAGPLADPEPRARSPPPPPVPVPVPATVPRAAHPPGDASEDLGLRVQVVSDGLHRVALRVEIVPDLVEDRC